MAARVMSVGFSWSWLGAIAMQTEYSPAQLGNPCPSPNGWVVGVIARVNLEPEGTWKILVSNLPSR